MNRLLVLLTLVIATNMQAQDTIPHWTYKGNLGLNFSHSSYTNWAAGGQNTLAWMGTFGYVVNYTKDNFKWDNTMSASLGYSFYDFEKKAVKNDDKIEFTSLAGLKAANKLNYSLELAFRSQFAKGYDYKVDSTIYTSRFLAPAYITLGAGMEWVPNDHFSVNFAPVAGRITIVNDTMLAAKGAYGVNELDKHDTVAHAAKTIRYEFGTRLSAKFKYTFFKNISLESKIDLFSNYLNHPERVDVNWQNLILFKVTPWLNFNLATHLIYDYDIKFPILDAEGDPLLNPDTGDALLTDGSKVQFKEVLSIGLLFNL